MAHSLRIEYPGAFDQGMARGNGCAAILRSDTHRVSFLRTLGQASGRTGWRIHAWVPDGNDYHALSLKHQSRSFLVRSGAGESVPKLRAKLELPSP